jgi:kynurenine formamidase
MVSRANSDIAAHGSAEGGQGSSPAFGGAAIKSFRDPELCAESRVRVGAGKNRHVQNVEQFRLRSSASDHLMPRDQQRRLRYDRVWLRSVGEGAMPSKVRFIVVFTLLVGFTGHPASRAHAQNDLTRAYRVIASKQFVDLTHSFGPDTPVWSGFGQAKMTPAADPKTRKPYTIKDDGFRATLYEMVGQYGTHVDPPAHFDDKGITMDEIPLKQMILPLIVLDNTRYLPKDPNHAFTVADLMAWEKRYGRVPRGAFVALRTDMYKDWDSDPERFKREKFPAWSLETIKFLYEQRGVVATGHESMDTDTTEKMLSETYLLQHGHYQIEVMANLDKVPAKGALIVVTWPKVQKGLGFPARAFAILP